MKRVLEDPAVPQANRLSTPILRDHIPDFLDEICDALADDGAGETSGGAVGNGETSKLHARQRVAVGYSMPEALRELSHLRSTLIDSCANSGSETDDRHLIHAAIDRAMTLAAHEIALSRLDDQRALKAAKDAAEAANQSKSLFLANMSHEIRSPLGVIIGYTEILRNESPSPEDRQVFVDTIAKSGKQLLRLVDDILDLSKVEAGMVELERLAVSLPEFLAEVTTLLTPRARAKGIELKVLAPEAPTTITTDPTRLRQVLVNIIGNAIKFTDSGAVKVEAKFVDAEGSRTAGTRLVFTITDTGLGLTAEAQARLFQPFTQADTSTTRRFGGTGLGLVLSQRLAQLLGGGVAIVASTPGVGSIFSVTIDPAPFSGSRRDPDTTSLEGDDEAAATTDSIEGRLAGVKVLLAEDAPAIQFLIVRVLNRAGAQVEAVGDGTAAVAVAFGGDHDIVLMDIQMPGLDGNGATEQLRRMGYKKPIVALTAHAMRDERERSLRAGCNDYMTKPLHQSRLVRTIERYTKHRRGLS